MLRLPIGLLLLLTLSGCLPSSCQRIDARNITPADSLSREMAALVIPDTLTQVWHTEGFENHPLEYPRTVLFGGDEQLYVSDAQRNSLYVFTTAGSFVEEVTWEEANLPYLAGIRGDTVLVFNPEAHRIEYLAQGERIHTVPTPTDLPKRYLQYVTATDEALYFKTVGENFEGYIVRLDEQGAITDRYTLPGRYWRYAGLLRPWGDSLISLSGFRPVIDVLSPRGTLDTLALVGFDSPMLARSLAYMRGDAHDAPLLSPAAAPAGDWLFVLNMRPGWLQVDVYDRTGHLQHILVEDAPAYNKEYYPIDLAVREREPGQFELAVILVEPAPQITLYRWHMP